MLDSLHIWLSKEKASNTDLLAETPCYLVNVSQHYKDSQVYLSGHIENLRVNINQSGVSIKGSLPKYFLNDNFNTLQRQDIERAFEKLSDDLHLPLIDAKITRLDIAQNFITKYKPENYYNYLGESQYFNRMEQPKSIYYSNRNRTKLFYNKIAEGKSKNYSIPEVWNNSNILRYEYRLTSRLSQHFKTEELKAKDLYNESFYISLLDEYVKEYEQIKKNNQINFNLNIMKSPKDFIKQMALLKIQEIGQNEVMKIIEEMRTKKVFSKKEYYSRLKNDIKELLNMPELAVSNELIEELDKKIKAVKENYR